MFLIAMVTLAVTLLETHGSNPGRDLCDQMAWYFFITYLAVCKMKIGLFLLCKFGIVRSKLITTVKICQ